MRRIKDGVCYFFIYIQQYISLFLEILQYPALSNSAFISALRMSLQSWREIEQLIITLCSSFTPSHSACHGNVLTPSQNNSETYKTDLWKIMKTPHLGKIKAANRYVAFCLGHIVIPEHYTLPPSYISINMVICKWPLVCKESKQVLKGTCTNPHLQIWYFESLAVSGYSKSACICRYDTVSDHLESLSTSVPEILTACRLNGQCSGLYG